MICDILKIKGYRMDNIRVNQAKADAVLSAVEKHLEKVEGAKVVSYGVKLASQESYSNHVFIFVS